MDQQRFIELSNTNQQNLRNLLKRYKIFEPIPEETSVLFCRVIDESCQAEAYNICINDMNIVPNYGNYYVRAYQYAYSQVYMEFTRQLKRADDYLLRNTLEQKNGLHPGRVALMTPREWDPTADAELYIINDARSQQKIERKTIKDYKCRNCGHRECLVHSEQRRRADEAATLIKICAYCGHH